MMSCSGNVVLVISLACGLISEGFGHEIDIVKPINDLLNDLNIPLKLTIMASWQAVIREFFFKHASHKIFANVENKGKITEYEIYETDRCFSTLLIETTLKFVRYINNGPNMYQIKIINGSVEIAYNMFEIHQEVVIVDLSCGYAPEIFSKISRQRFNYYKIIVFDSSINTDLSIDTFDSQMQQLFHNCPILPMSQIFLICRNSEDTNFLIKEVYRMGLNEPLVIKEFASYKGKQYTRSTSLTTALRRRNLQGFQLKASMVILNNDSLNHLDDYRDLHIDAESKHCYQLTNHLIGFVNGTVKFSIVPAWGYKNLTTGEWNGMVGEILRNVADIGATALFFTTDRLALIEYISQASTSNSAFIFLSPKLSYTDNIYLLPFDRLLWTCMILLVLLISTCLVGAVVFELKAVSYPENRCSVRDVSMIILGALCQQGTAVTPKSVTARIIMAIAFIFLMFLFVSWSANIVAILQSPSNKIKSLQNLYDAKIDASILDTVYNRHFFARETEPFRKKFYENKLHNKDGKPKFNELVDGIKKVREGEYAFFTELSGAYKIIGETFMDIEKCGLQVINFFQMKLNPWYAIQKNSSYKEVLKIGMMRLQEHGIKNREILRHYLSKPKCISSGANFVSVSVIDTRPAMLIFLWGFVIALIVFGLELTVAHSKVIRNKLWTLKNYIANKISPNFSVKH